MDLLWRHISPRVRVVVRTGESLQNCPYLAVWSLDPVVQMVSSHVLLDVVVHDRSLSRGLPFTCPPPEQYFNPTTYNFGACIYDVLFIVYCCRDSKHETLKSSRCLFCQQSWIILLLLAGTDSTCLMNSGIVHLTCSGYQKEASFSPPCSPPL